MGVRTTCMFRINITITYINKKGSTTTIMLNNSGHNSNIDVKVNTSLSATITFICSQSGDPFYANNLAYLNYSFLGTRNKCGSSDFCEYYTYTDGESYTIDITDTCTDTYTINENNTSLAFTGYTSSCESYCSHIGFCTSKILEYDWLMFSKCVLPYTTTQICNIIMTCIGTLV